MYISCYQEMMIRILIFGILVLINSSCTNCDEKEYFDVKDLKLKNSNTIVETRDFPFYSLIARFDADNFRAYGDCFDGNLGSEEFIDNITIITNDDFNENYGKNDVINDMIKVCYYSCQEEILLDSYLSQPNLRLANPEINFRFTIKPTHSKLYSFTLQITFTNGESYTAI